MELTIANVGIRQDEQGRYCLNDLHKASGAADKTRPAYFFKLQSTTDLINAVEIDGNPSNEQNQRVRKDAFQSKTGIGTFVCKELVYAYAMWISPVFHLKVIRTFDAVTTQPATQIPQTFSEALRLAADMAEQNALLAPKAAIADRLTGSAGNMNIRNAAKALKMKEHDFVKWLLLNKWIFRNKKGRLEGYASHTPRFVEHKVTPIPVDGEEDRVSLQVMIAPEGLTKLAGIFNVTIDPNDTH